MSKMQLIAKMSVTLLGIYAVSHFLKYMDFINTASSDSYGPKMIIAIMLPLVIIALTICFMILKNNWLATRLTGSVASDDAILNTVQLAKAMRTAMVFAGLMLLPLVTNDVKLLLDLPVSLRALTDVVFSIERFSHQLPEDYWYWINLTRAVISLLLTAYLICGAPHYVRWQARKSCGQAKL